MKGARPQYVLSLCPVYPQGSLFCLHHVPSVFPWCPQCIAQHIPMSDHTVFSVCPQHVPMYP